MGYSDADHLSDAATETGASRSDIPAAEAVVTDAGVAGASSGPTAVVVNTESLSNGPTSGLLKWLRRGGWALADQASFSLANFLVQVLLGRWLADEAAYGAFVTAFTWFIFVGNFHSTLLVDPLLVFGSGKFTGVLRKYVNALFAMSLLLSGIGVAFFMLVGLGYWVFDGGSLAATSLWSIGLASPFIFMLWLVRRVCYVRLDPAPAAISGFVYLVLMSTGLIWLKTSGHLSIPSAMTVMALSSLLVSTVLLWREGATWRLDPQITREAVADHWSYGRWAMNSGLLMLLPGHLFYLLLPAFYSYEASGSMRAMWNVFMPFVQANAAFCGLLVPSLVRTWGTAQFRRALQLALVVIVGFPVLMCVVSAIFPSKILHVVYGQRYDDYANLLWLLGLQVVLMGMLSICHAMLASRQKANQIFVACVVSSVIGLVFLIPVMQIFGIVGAIVLGLVSAAVNIVISYHFARNLGRVTPSIDDDPARVGEPPRVLVVAFACEPGQGSELGVGWGFVHGLSQRQPVWVICHPMFREGIEAHMPEHQGHPIHFSFLSLPKRLDWMLKRTPTLNVYYYLWNIMGRKKIKQLHKQVQFDLVQHVSYMRYWMPSLGAAAGVPFVWGPVGGGESTPGPYLKTLGRMDRLRESARSSVRQLFEFDPFLRLAAANTTVALAATEQTADCFRRLGVRQVRTVPPVLLSATELRQFRALQRPGTDGVFRFVCVGRLLHWKGFQFGLRAFAEAGLQNAEFVVIGSGPYRRQLEALARRLGVADKVRFEGSVTRDKCIELMSRCHVLVHPSLHDSGGLACLEALAMGKPILCVDTGGPGVIVNETCGVLGSADSPSLAIEQFVEMMRRWTADAALYRRMSRAAEVRAEELSQQRQAGYYDRLYNQLLGRPVDEERDELEYDLPRIDGVAIATGAPEL